MTQEQWLPVFGYEGIYSVSNTAMVRRDRANKGARAGYILKQSIMSAGYLGVSLLCNGVQATRTVHSLVAEAFLGPCPENLSVNHKDGNKLNNSPENLEYVTLAENARHAHRTGLYPKKITHCHKGHPYDESNTALFKDGQRGCRQCGRERNRKHSAKKKGKVATQ